MKKLTTQAEVTSLRAGGTIKRFPNNSDDALQDTFDALRKKDIDTFTIRSINAETNMLSLVTTHEANDHFASTVMVGRLFISQADLVGQKVWWV